MFQVSLKFRVSHSPPLNRLIANHNLTATDVTWFNYLTVVERVPTRVIDDT